MRICCTQRNRGIQQEIRSSSSINASLSDVGSVGTCALNCFKAIMYLLVINSHIISGLATTHPVQSCLRPKGNN